MDQKKTGVRINPLYGIGVFAFVILMMYVVFAPIQHALGIYGLAITELILLIIAIAVVFIFRMNFKEVFAVKKPHVRQIFGTILLWLGSYLLVMLVSIFIAIFFPERFAGVNNSLSSVLSSVPVGLAFLISAVMPAVCEEALHRGFILSTFRNVNNKWIVIISMGVIFGIFHTDPVRFFPTAFLGMALTYLMIETHNILLPMLFHLINNTPAALLSFLSVSGAESEQAMSSIASAPFSIMGVYLIFASCGPLFILSGALLIKHKKLGDISDTKERSRIINQTTIAGVLSFLMFVFGILMILSQIIGNPQLYNNLMS